jgi:F-type H+-transporting ATPase subunit b
LKVESSEAKIRDALASARTEIETVAAQATRDMVQRLTGIQVDAKDAASAVKAELNV